MQQWTALAECMQLLLKKKTIYIKWVVAEVCKLCRLSHRLGDAGHVGGLEAEGGGRPPVWS